MKGVAPRILMKLSSYLRYLSGDRLRLLLSYYRRRVGGSAVLRLLRCDPISVVSLLSPGLRASFGALTECFVGLADVGRYDCPLEPCPMIAPLRCPVT